MILSSSAFYLVVGGAFLLLAPIKTSYAAIEIRRISDRIPEDSFSRRVRTDGTGDCFVYEGDVQYQYNGTANPAFGEGYKHIWKTCNVFDETENKRHVLLSTLRTSNGEDDDFPTVSSDGTKVCYFTGDLGYNAIALTDTESMTLSYFGLVLTDDYDRRRSTYCDVSPDGSAIAFQSSASLVRGGVANPDNRYQIYVTYDHGATYQLVAGEDIANEGVYNLLSSYPQLSREGKRISYEARLPYNDSTGTPVEIRTNELYLYDRASDRTERLTNFNEDYCNLTEIFELMQDYWGADNLTSEGITSASATSCNLIATLQLGGINSANLLGIGHGPARMSDNGRFITYTAGFEHATIRGTYETAQIITAGNLFLHDTTLGLVWQITQEGSVELNHTQFEARVEEFCCPSAPSSRQRDTCSRRSEYRGFCCWQRPCWFPAQWPDISGDGTSVTFFSDKGFFPSDLNVEVARDWEIIHYHIPTSTRTIVTNTSNSDLDDAYPSISDRGDVVAWESDFDYTTNESITGNNQVFAARIQYGCPHYPGALNYLANPDVNVTCEFPRPTAMYFSGHGVSIRLGMDMGSMLSNVPFFGSGRVNKRRLCKVLLNDVRRDLAYTLKVPETFLLIQRLSNNRCLRMESGTSISVNIGFASSKSDHAFDQIYKNIGEPEMWYRLVNDAYLDTTSDFWRRYLLKTAQRIRPLYNMRRRQFLDW